MFDATPLFRIYARRRLAQLASADPVDAQRRQLLALVRQARDTRFGRDHGFADIDGVEAFQARVPLGQYETFWEAYWKDAFPVLKDLTWPGRIPYFAQTSGTATGITKYIPVSRAMVRANRRAAKDMLAFHLAARPDSRVLGGTNFLLGANPALTRQAPGVHSGDLTGIAAREVPLWARAYFFPRGADARIADWERKVEAQGRASLARDVRMISGTASWLLLFFDRLGRIAGKPGAPLAELYPKLELVVHGGVNIAPYRARFDAYLDGSRAEMREVYPASEGFLAIADRGAGQGLRLITDNGLFYEFVPVADLDGPSPRRHWLGTVETGVNYAVALSTCAGAWAYLLGDTVRFVDLDPPRLLITGRISYHLSAFGEHLTGEEVERAVAAGAAAIGAAVQDFSVAPLFPDEGRPAGRHLFIVEFIRPPGEPAMVARFARVLDQTLSAQNIDYGVRRDGDFGMLAPQIRVAPPGTFARWMKARGKLGGQNKVARVITDPALLATLEAELPTDARSA